MDHFNFKKASTLIEHDPRDLRQVVVKLKMLEDLNRKIAVYIDTSLMKYCQVANLVGGKLTLIGTNGSVATQLRYLSPDLIRKFSQDLSLKHIHRIECKVRPPTSYTRLNEAASENMPLLSPQTSEIVSEIATTIKDEELRKVMERIATRVKE